MIGRHIKRARERAGFTQEGLGAKANVSRVYIAKLETGEKDNPSIKVVQRLARALKIKVTDLLR